MFGTEGRAGRLRHSENSKAMIRMLQLHIRKVREYLSHALWHQAQRFHFYIEKNSYSYIERAFFMRNIEVEALAKRCNLMG